MIPDEIVEKAARAVHEIYCTPNCACVITLAMDRDIATAALSAVYADIQASGIRSAADQFGVYCGDDDDEWTHGYQQAQRETIFKLTDIAAEIESGDPP